MILNFPGGTEENHLNVCVRFVGFGGQASAWQQSLTIFIDCFLGLLTDIPEEQDDVIIQTRLLFCTMGILLQRLASDPELSSVTHIIVDEVLERSEERFVCVCFVYIYIVF
jgi:hypothetical protein